MATEVLFVKKKEKKGSLACIHREATSKQGQEKGEIMQCFFTEVFHGGSSLLCASGHVQQGWEHAHRARRSLECVVQDHVLWRRRAMHDVLG